MPIKKARRAPRKSAPRRRLAGRRRVVRKPRKSNAPEWASLSVKRTYANPASQDGLFAANTLYNLMNTSLNQFPRAVQVAQAYQHYRISKVAVTFKPSYDTYVSQNAGVTKPRIYYMIDKSGAIPTNIALEGLKAMGARPLELDENPRTVRWAPSVLEVTMDNPLNVSSKYRISPWLATNAGPLTPGVFVPSSVDHLGLYWYVDQLANPQGQVYQVEVEVQFQFKKPLSTILSTVSAIGAKPADINDSPDGIVGGTDDHLASPSLG